MLSLKMLSLKNLMTKTSSVLAFAVVASVFTAPVYAQEAKSLDELLKRVESGRIADSKENWAREKTFKNALARQDQMLRDVRKERASEEKRSTVLESDFEKNDKKLTAAEVRLRDRMGSLTELFGHITTAAGDARSNFETSLISIHYPDRGVVLDSLIEKASSGSQLPNIEEIESLWFELQREMTESGKVVMFPTTVSKPNGDKVKQQVVRIGSYNLISDSGAYLSYDNGSKVLEQLARQPGGAANSDASTFAGLKTGVGRVALDPTGPSGGSYLAAMINSPTLQERWHQGGYVGYVITGVGAFALLIALWRLIYLSLVGAKVSSQLKSDQPSAGNPLGRVLMAGANSGSKDIETLELKLNEAVLKELPSLESGQNLLKIIAGIAPLLGLLGTVTGMIMTFQAITIFGAGDPKAMAGGISGALITTVLGLLVAIPTVLLHTWVSSRSKKVIHILEEQSAGLIAQRDEA